MLQDIEAFIRERRRVCLADLTARFAVPAPALMPMLELLESRGRIRRVPVSDRDCGGCGQCDPALLSMWEWDGPDEIGPGETASGPAFR